MESDGTDSDRERKGVVVQTIVMFIVSGTTLWNADAGLIAAGLGPSAAYAVDRAVTFLSRRRYAQAEETLNEAAATADVPVEQFINEALADDKRSELLVRALTAAQDVALREKRRAFGRALADGVTGDSSIDDEFLFIRALADLDEPHIVVLQVIGSNEPAHYPLPKGWQHNEILERVPRLANALRAILRTLELHTLITRNLLASEVGATTDFYRISDSGRLMLSRLVEQAS